MSVRTWWRRRQRGTWAPIRTIWPFEDGWGVYNKKRGMVLETGLPTRELAQAICDDENAREARP